MNRSVSRGGILKLGFWACYLAALAFGVALVSRDLDRIISSPDRLAPAFGVVLGQGNDRHAAPAPAPGSGLSPPAAPQPELAPAPAPQPVTLPDRGTEAKARDAAAEGRSARPGSGHGPKHGR